jgi:hypothetical protein
VMLSTLPAFRPDVQQLRFVRSWGQRIARRTARPSESVADHGQGTDDGGPLLHATRELVRVLSAKAREVEHVALTPQEADILKTGTSCVASHRNRSCPAALRRIGSAEQAEGGPRRARCDLALVPLRLRGGVDRGVRPFRRPAKSVPDGRIVTYCADETFGWDAAAGDKPVS